MLNQNSEPKAQTSSNAGSAETTAALLDPQSPIEVSSVGNGTTTDPAGKDTKPPAP